MSAVIIATFQGYVFCVTEKLLQFPKCYEALCAARFVAMHVLRIAAGFTCCYLFVTIL